MEGQRPKLPDERAWGRRETAQRVRQPVTLSSLAVTPVRTCRQRQSGQQPGKQRLRPAAEEPFRRGAPVAPFHQVVMDHLQGPELPGREPMQAVVPQG